MTPIQEVPNSTTVVPHANGTDAPTSKAGLLDLIESHVRHNPHAVAIRSSDDSLTYRELWEKSGRLTNWLIGHGVGADVPVAIELPRSTHAMIAILGVWRSGGGYVPIDLSYPTERRAMMLAVAAPMVTVTDDVLQTAMNSSAIIAETKSSDASLGYILFTSGSTGRPKGVAMPRGPLCNLVRWQLKQSKIQPGEATLQFAPLSFDVHFQELFSTWCAGGTLVIPSEDERRDPLALLRLLQQQRVARIYLPFIVLNQIADTAGDMALDLREVITAGEQLRITPAIRKFFQIRPNCTLTNQYGPTETHVVTAHLLTVAPATWPDLPPIGRPIDGVTIGLFDEQLRPSTGTGEIWIGGDCLARGYLGRPELTSERFVNHEGKRWYRSGDVGQWNKNNELEYLGRIDTQVKIRGFRVEPGEIEAVMSECAGVREVAVIAREDTPGDKRIIAYIAGDSANENNIRHRLTERLPEWMIPSAFVWLPAIPRTPNGKLDRNALPAPGRMRPALAAAFTAPKSETEKRLAEVWRDVLQIDELGVNDPFFDLGGHSLALARVHAKLRDQFGIDISITTLFRFPTIASLAKQIDAEPSEITSEFRQAKARSSRSDSLRSAPIAIVGMAGRFPGAANVRQFWTNLCNGVESVRTFTDDELLAAGVPPELVRNPDYAKARATLTDVDSFDAAFFGLQPREAELTDPQHRLFLETAWSALEDAGYVPEQREGRVGVFAGCSMNTYLLNNVLSDPAAMQKFLGEFQSGGYNVLVGNDKDYLATRVAYKLNLRGPAVAIQTACSTSLVAVCEAVESLRSGDCDMAIAGGASVTFPQIRGALYQEGAITSPDGHCRPFDANARGTVFGEGVAAVVLKPLDQAIADGDPIYAVIRGAGLSNDGSDKVSYLAPSVDGQVDAIRRALEQANIDPGTIGYVEAHGTGTPLGDPIEVAALAKAFGPTKTTCLLGSVKANIGHLEAAAGVTGLIKTALTLHHRQIPPTPNFRRPNPALCLDATNFQIASKLQSWESSTPRRAAVSSLGVGGTNAHVVLEESPTSPIIESDKAQWKQHLVLASARTAPALERAITEFAEHLESNHEVHLGDVAYTSQVGRRRFEHRRWIVADSFSNAAAELRSISEREPARITPGATADIVFLFPGQGSQFVGLCKELYQAEPTFRAQFVLCCELFQQHLNLDLRGVLFPSPDDAESASRLLVQTRITQPALFFIEYSLAQMFIGWGVRPTAMFGHSIGEFAAACVAGVMTLEDATGLVAQRGELIQNCPAGVMLAVQADESAVTAILPAGLEIAAVNSPTQTVVSGAAARIEEFEAILTKNNKKFKRLVTSHAFHSALLQPAVAPFRAAVAKVALKPPAIRFISCVTGTWITDEQATSPDYWASQLRHSVRCRDGLATLVGDESKSLLELGGGSTLVNFARASLPRERLAGMCAGIPRDEKDDTAWVLRTLGELWEAGADIDWHEFHALTPRRRVHLPTYPFERKRFWIEPRAKTAATLPAVSETHYDSVEHAAVAEQPAPTTESILPEVQRLFAELGGLVPDAVAANATFLELGFDSLFLTQAVQAIQARFAIRVTFRQLLESLDTPAKLAVHVQKAGSQKKKSEIESQPALEKEPSAPGTAAGDQPPITGFGSLAPVDRSSDSDWSESQLHFVEQLVDRVVERTKGSKRHVQDHRRVHADPRTVSGFTRQWKEMVYPIVVVRSAGSRLWDIDGNEYIDLLNGFGPDLLGHSPQYVVDAVSRQLASGYEVGPLAPQAGELAQLVCDMTGMDRASFVCTGSEAVQAALRAARTVTGRELVVTFARDYHGNFDEVLLRPNPSDQSKPAVASVPGVPRAAVSNMIVLEYGTDASLEIIRRLGPQLAAILVEPVQSRRPELQPRAFLYQLRRIADESGAALILDEVITGFRLHPGGAQAFFGVRADIATYGKVIGGGMPIGAVAGRSRFMDAFDGGWWQFGDESFPEAGRTFFAGTFVRHPLALAAGVAALQHLRQQGPELQHRLNERSDRLVAALNQIAHAAGVPLEIVNCGSLMFFRVLHGSKEASLLFYLLREKGIYILEGFPSYLSTAHTDADLMAVEIAFRESVEEMQRAGFFGSVSEDDLLPLTAAQSELWLAAQLGNDASRAFNETCTLRLKGKFNIPAFRTAVSRLIERHEALRAVFDESGAGQKFLDRVTIDVPLIDLSSASDPETAFRQLQEGEDGFVFDLAAGPLLNVRVVQFAHDEHAILLTVHHIACDGWSYDVLLRELGSLYTSAVAGNPDSLPPAEQFGQYAVERRISAKDRAFWKARFDPSPSPCELPSRPRPANRTFRGTRFSRSLGYARAEAIRALASQTGCTNYAVMLASFEVLLHRLTGQNDVVLGIPTAGQARVGAKSLVGHCVNFLPIRQQFAEGQSFKTFATVVQQQLLDALEHGDFTYVELLRDLGPSDPTRPLVGIGFNLDPRLSTLEFGGLKAQVAKNPKHFVNLELHWNLVDEGDGYTLEAEYNTDLFDEASIQRWSDCFIRLLDEIARDPNQSIDRLTMIDEQDRHRMLVEWNATNMDYPDQRVEELFAGQVRRRPDTPALLFGDQTISYSELDRRAELLAGTLENKGVGNGSPVAVLLPRSPDLIVALLAVLKAGGAYMPLDENHPPTRRAQLLADAGATFVVTGPNDIASFPPGLVVIPVNASNSSGRKKDSCRRTASDCAAVLYTSGSTGRPKGAMVTHCGIVRLLFNARVWDYGSDHVIAFIAPIVFDAGSFEIWAALLHGAPLAIYPDAVPDLANLGKFLRDHRVDSLWLTAGLFNSVVDYDVETLNGVRQLVTGGEAMSLAHARRARAELPNTVLINGYGPTETAMFATTFRLPEQIPADWTSVPIGRPIGNTVVFILDSNHQPVPIGVAGELYIGGPGVAKGYLNDPVLTADRFVPSPVAEYQGTLYRTGDRVRWRDDGQIEFLSRFDDQVKIRGHRIEPREVELVLASHTDVAACAVIPRGKGADTQLVAYVVPRQSGSRDPGTYIRFLKERLPAYLVPASVVFLDSLPLTTNGKLDRAALPDATIVSPPRSGRHVAPRIDAQRELLPIWAEVLGVSDLGITDNFFDFGGHSLKAVALVTAIRRRLGHSLPLGALYKAPTVEAFARLIQEKLEGATGSCVVPLQELGSRPPLFMVAGVGGHVFAFHKFARLLGTDQPTYGIKAIGVDGSQKPPDSVEEIASEYVREIQTARPNGPYLLTGYSLGAVLAFEVALQLRALGHSVPLLIAFDASAPGYLSMSVLRRARLHFANLFLRGGGWAYVKQRLTNLRNKLNWKFGRAHKTAPVIEGLEMFSQQAITDVWIALHQAYHKYKPSRKFDGRVHVFRSEIVEDWDKFVSDDPNLGWSRYAAHVDSESLAVKHLDMFQEPAIGDLARRTDEVIRKYGRG